MVARCRHWSSLTPGVGFRIVFLNGSNRSVRRSGTQGRLCGTSRQTGAANYVDLIANRGGHRRTPLGGHWCECFPGIGGWIVFPGVVDRHPRRWAGRRIHESAKRVNLPVIFRERHVVRRKRHGFFLGPMIGGRIVFVDQSLRLPKRNQAGEDIHFPAGRPRPGFLRPARGMAPASHLACAKAEGSAALKESIATANCNPVKISFLKAILDSCVFGWGYYTTDSDSPHPLSEFFKELASGWASGRDPVCPRECPFRPEKRGTERPLQNLPGVSFVCCVEAARFWGGQPFVSLRIKLPRFHAGSFVDNSFRLR